MDVLWMKEKARRSVLQFFRKWALSDCYRTLLP